MFERIEREKRNCVCIPFFFFSFFSKKISQARRNLNFISSFYIVLKFIKFVKFTNLSFHATPFRFLNESKIETEKFARRILLYYKKMRTVLTTLEENLLIDCWNSAEFPASSRILMNGGVRARASPFCGCTRCVGGCVVCATEIRWNVVHRCGTSPGVELFAYR